MYKLWKNPKDKCMIGHSMGKASWGDTQGKG